MPRKPFSSTWIALTIAACSAPESPQPEVRAQPGDWEGFVETTRQTVYIQTDLEAGVATLGGNDLPMVDLRLAEDSVEFTLDLGPQKLLFSGSSPANDRLAGSVLASFVDSDDAPVEFTFELFRLPAFGRPADRLEAWRQDLAHVRSRFLRYDRSYSALARRRAEALLDELERDLAGLDESEILVRISRIAAAADNAHTRFYLLRNRTALRRVPMRLWWFADGLFVVRASDRYAEAVGCRVEGVAGRPATTAREAVSSLFAGNESWTDYKSTYFLTAPTALHGLGLSEDSLSIRYDLICRDGPRSIDADAAPLVRLDGPTENWRNLAPGFAGELDLLPPEEGHWVPPLRGRSAPLYLQNPERHYWLEVLPDARAVYVQYNRSANDPSAESLGDFGDRVLEVLDGPDVTAAVVDLRFNTGGDLGVGRQFFDRLVGHPDLAAGGRLMVLTDQATFSAGLYHAAQLRASGLATLIGREPGDRLEYWSEGGNLILPNSGYTLHFANGYHSYSGKPDPRVEKLFESLSVPSLEPDIETRTTSSSFFAGEDPLLDAAREGIRSSSRE